MWTPARITTEVEEDSSLRSSYQEKGRKGYQTDTQQWCLTLGLEERAELIM